jgi:hypothetical protein
LKHLVAVISGHGYGHLGQTAPVLNALHEQLPDLRLTIRSRLPEQVLRRRIPWEFNLVEDATDFGMVMHDALSVDADASAMRYAGFHSGWQTRVDEEARQLELLAPDVVLSNVAYLPLAGASRAGMPSLAMCSLNWADIYRHYCEDAAGSASVLDQIESAYQRAGRFLRLTPGMPMSWLVNAEDLNPVASRGCNRRETIIGKLGLSPDSRIALLSMGGIDHRMDLSRWPSLPDVNWIVPEADLPVRADMHSLEELDLPFLDVLASSDVLLTKPGYGNFVEAAAHGVAVLYVGRPDWPEEPWLVFWLQQHGRCRELVPTVLQSGKMEGDLCSLLDGRPPVPVPADGAAQAAKMIAEQMR